MNDKELFFTVGILLLLIPALALALSVVEWGFTPLFYAGVVVWLMGLVVIAVMYLKNGGEKSAKRD